MDSSEIMANIRGDVELPTKGRELKTVERKNIDLCRS